VHINIGPQRLNFRRTTPTFTRIQSFRFLSVGIPKTPTVFSSNW